MAARPLNIYERTGQIEPIIFHIDVNSAFLSWTALDLLEAGEATDLRQIPSVIGGDQTKRHGVVLAKSAPARAYGIQTGEPIAAALRKCPGLTLASPDHKMYAARSRQLMDYLSSLCPLVEQVSIDECYMDFTSIAHLYSSWEEAAYEIKDSIYERFHFTVNIGISNRKVLAKMASDFEKPNRVHTLFTHQVREKMWPLPINRLYMCGHSSVNTLRKLEILTIGDLAKANPEIIAAHLKSHGILLHNYANGIDTSVVESAPYIAKGIGNSTTLRTDIGSREEALPVFLGLAESVASRLRRSGQLALMVSCEIKYSTFRSVSHQTTLSSPTDSADVIYQTACSLFDELWNRSPVRLLGIRTSRLTDHSEPIQMNLFDLAKQKTTDAHLLEQKSPEFDTARQQKLNQALDKIKHKYGDSAVIRGSLLKEKKPF